MKKRINNWLLVALIAFATFFTSFSPQIAEASTNKYQVSNPEIKHLTEKVYLKFTNDGKTSKVSKSEIEKIKEKVKTSHKEYDSNSLYNTKKVDPSSLNSKQNESSNLVEPLNTTVSYAEITNDVIFDSTNRTITLKATLTNLVGTPPVIILTGYDLFSNKSVEGTYTKVTGFDVEWTGPDIYVGKSHSLVYNVVSTNFWMTQSVTTAGWLGSYPETQTGQGGPALANKKASFYPTIYNEHSGQYMPIPARADMPVVPLEERAPWNNTLRGQYITAYIDTYGNPNWDWSLIDIHHVIPREYGGGNTFGNLYPLPRDLHQQVVTPWWSSY